MRKIVVGIFASIVTALIFALTGCGNSKILSRPVDTDLEFWIADDVTSFDFD